MTDRPVSIAAADAPARTKPSNYPEPFALRMAGRVKCPLGDLFGLSRLGVNLTRLPAGTVSSLHHQHSRQDECIYVLEGTPTLITGASVADLGPGMVAGFAAGGTAHHLENRTTQDCLILEIGDRAGDDAITYPADELAAVSGDQGWIFVHKDGDPY